MPSLDKRLSSTRREVEERRRARPLAQLEREVAALAPIRPFTESIAGEEISFVQRVKEADGALLELAEELDVAGLAAALGPLAGMGADNPLPVLLTDMIVGAYQLYECRLGRAGARGVGAGAVEGEPERAGGGLNGGAARAPWCWSRPRSRTTTSGWRSCTAWRARSTWT